MINVEIQPVINSKFSGAKLKLHKQTIQIKSVSELETALRLMRDYTITDGYSIYAIEYTIDGQLNKLHA